MEVYELAIAVAYSIRK